MLNFDAKGHLVPYEPIKSKVRDLKKYLVDDINSDSRLDHYKKYIRYSNSLKALIGGQELKQWINGSFVTKKLNPKDIDLVTFIDSEIIVQLGNKLDTFVGTTSYDVYGVDAYIIEVHPPKSKQAFRTDYNTLEWLDLFSHTKRNRRGHVFDKGFLEIFY